MPNLLFSSLSFALYFQRTPLSDYFVVFKHYLIFFFDSQSLSKESKTEQNMKSSSSHFMHIVKGTCVHDG